MKNILRIFTLLSLFLAIQASVSGQNVAVTGADAATNAASPFATLAAAFTSINATAQTGNTIAITIIGNTTEPAAGAILNAGVWTSISIQPSGGAARTISGAATAGVPLIDFNGADNVTVDGLNTGGNSLTIDNTTVSATSGTSTIRFQTDATNNTITKCSVLGASTMAVGTNGGNIWFGAGAVTTGNDNNAISNCDIGPSGSNLPTKGIYFSGTATPTALNNSGITISNNNIFDYFGAATTNAGVYITSGTTDITITGNRFYQTATRTQTTGTQHSAVWITNTSGNNFQVLNNIIGYASNTQTGTYTFVGASASKVIPIFLGVGTTTVSSVQGNTIASMAISGAMSGTSSSAAFRGIYVSSGLTTIGDVTGNTIGSQSATGSITYTSSSTSASDVTAIFNFGSNNWTTNNNTIGGITASNSSTGASNVYGLRCNTSSTATWACNNNTIGGTVANSLQSTTTATGSIVQGILNNNPIGTFTGNTIRNLTAAGGTGTTTSASVVGICITASSANHTIGQNTIFNLNNTNTTAATVVTGIQYTGSTGANVVERNLIYGLTSATTSATAEINGIRVGGGTTQYRNNFIAIGAGVANAIGGAATNSSTAGIVGFNEALGTNSIWHNSIYIGGTATAGTGSSYAFNGVQTTNTRSFRDNIFFNARTNSGATGKHYAVKINGTAPNPTGLTINNNVYFADGTGSVFGFFNSADVANITAWRTAVGQDAASFESNPRYLDPTNAVPDLHIDPTLTTAVEGNGVDLGVTLDYDGQTRSGLTPVDIGADAGNFMGIDLAPPSITYTLLTNTNSTSNRTTSSFATITDVSGVNVTAGTAPRIYYKKTTDPNVWNDNTSATTGWKFAESTTGSSPFDFTIDYSLLNSAPVVVNDTIQYFVVAQDLGVPTVGINSGTFAATPASVALTSTAFPIGGAINRYIIQPAISGTKTVCPTGCDYTTLTVAGGAFAAINSSVVTGNITLEIAGDLTAETGAVSLTEFLSPFTVTIKPTGSARTISGSSAGSLITLNGADRVTIDGSLGSTANTICPPSAASRDLTIINTNTGTTSAVIWLTHIGTNGANDNTIKNCNIEGNSPTTTLLGLGSGGTIGGAATTASHNNNSFVNNNFSKMQIAIYSFGIGGASKDQNTTISQNLINTAAPNNVSRGGITAGAKNNLTVSGNNITGMNIATTVDAFAIALGSIGITTSTTSTTFDCTNSTVTFNTIGTVRQTNTYSAMGILLAPGATGTSLIANNTISAVSANATSGDFSVGIFVVPADGSTTNVYHNTVNMNGTETGGNDKSYAIAVGGGTTPTVDIRNNILLNTLNTGSGLNYAIGLGYSTFTNITSNNNDLHTTTGALYAIGATGSISTPTNQVTLANWQTATGKDGASFSEVPTFVSATDLHLNMGLTSTRLESGGASVSVTNDIDCQTRPGPTMVNGGGTSHDVGADEFDGVPAISMTYVSSTVAQVTGTAFAGVINQEIIRIQVVTAGTLSPLSVTNFDLNANGTTDIANINAATAKMYYTGSSTTFSTATPFGAGVTPTISTFSITGTQTLATGNNYFWLAYDVTAGSPTGNVIDGECTSITVGSPQTPSVTAPAGNKVILGPMAGNYNVGVGQVTPNFVTITEAANNLNNRGVSAAVTITLLDATYNSGSGEVFPVVINAITGASSTNTITIRPNTGVASTVSGAASDIIELSGADFITIDGLNTGGSSLTFSNTSTSTGTSVITVSSLGAAAGATNNTIKNCTIQNGTVGSTSITNFGIFAGLNTGAANGPDNDNLTILNNTIRRATIGVQVVGGTTAGQQNDNLLIENNTIGDDVVSNSLGRIGISVGQATTAVVRKNTIKNAVTSDVAITASNNATGIAIGTGVTNSSFDANTIRDIKYTSTGGYGGKGIDISTGNASSNLTISNNMISNIMGDGWSTLPTDAIVGIRIEGTTGGVNLYHNTVNLGSGTFAGNTSGTQSAALFIGSSVTALNIRNNIFVTNLDNTNAVAKTWAVNSAAPNTAFTAINYNDYSVSGTEGILGFLTADQATLAAWQTATAQDANSVNIAPVFTSATDLHLPDGSNPTLFDLGTPIGGVTTDIDNEGRSASAPDMGADEFSPITLNLTAFIEGYYTGASTMTPVHLNVVTAGFTVPGNASPTASQCDFITVELRNSTPPYAVAASFTGILGTNGTLSCKFPSDKVGGTYFIALKHRNSVETWSGAGADAPTSFASATTSYNFSTAADQAYMSNMVDMGGGVWAIYAGEMDDLNMNGLGDGIVDNTDFGVWLIDAENFEEGYIRTDLNGDAVVDNIDFAIWLINSENFVEVLKP